jgi:hypothetical protein
MDAFVVTSTQNFKEAKRNLHAVANQPTSSSTTILNSQYNNTTANMSRSACTALVPDRATAYSMINDIKACPPVAQTRYADPQKEQRSKKGSDWASLSSSSSTSTIDKIKAKFRSSKKEPSSTPTPSQRAPPLKLHAALK